MANMTPVNQVRLTNVAYVRFNKKGKRFEIACYRNKVLNWRNKVETDLDEVLQIDTVFTNVSKGMLASKQDLLESFGTSDQKVVCREILDNGELQVSEQERQALFESTFRDVASIVAEKAINPENNRPYTISMIQNAMRQIHYSVNVSKSAKQQALDVIKKLKDVMPIARANMLLRIVTPITYEDEIRQLLSHEFNIMILKESNNNNTTTSTSTSITTPPPPPDVTTITTSSDPSTTTTSTVDSDTNTSASSSTGASGGNIGQKGDVLHFEIRVEPDVYRKLEQLVSTITSAQGRVDILQLAAAGSAATSNVVPSTSISSEKTDKAGPTTSAGVGGKGKKKAKDKVKDVEVHVEVDEKNMLKDLMKLNVEDEDNNSSDEVEVEGPVIPKNKKNEKKKLKKTLHKISTVTDESTTANTASDEEDAVDSSLLPTSTTQQGHQDKIESTITSTSTSTSTDSSMKNKEKIGKKTKRIQKEELKEREVKIEMLKQRAEKESNTTTTTTTVQTTIDSTTSTSTSTSSTDTQPSVTSSVSTPTNTSESATSSSTGKISSCNTCTGTFTDANAYRNHFKSEWHRHNLKRKLKGKSIVTSEEAFRALPIEEIEGNLN